MGVIAFIVSVRGNLGPCLLLSTVGLSMGPYGTSRVYLRHVTGTKILYKKSC